MLCPCEFWAGIGVGFAVAIVAEFEAVIVVGHGTVAAVAIAVAIAIAIAISIAPELRKDCLIGMAGLAQGCVRLLLQLQDIGKLSQGSDWGEWRFGERRMIDVEYYSHKSTMSNWDYSSRTGRRCNCGREQRRSEVD